MELIKQKLYWNVVNTLYVVSLLGIDIIIYLTLHTIRNNIFSHDHPVIRKKLWGEFHNCYMYFVIEVKS